MIALTVVLLAGQIVETPKLRTILPSGSVVFVERITGPGVSVCLQASSRGADDSPATHGYRHLLEHLLAKGPSQELDRQLEAKGLYLTASTTRDSMRFQIDGPAGKLPEALSAIAELLKPLSVEQTDIAAESKILAQEFALRDANDALIDGSWDSAFAGPICSPDGTLSIIETATPSAIESLRLGHFAANNLVLSISGDVDVNKSTALAKSALVGAPKRIESKQIERSRESSPEPFSAVGATGVSRAVVVDGISTQSGLASLAAALTIASQVDGSRIVYTPSIIDGVIVLIAPYESDFSEIIEGRDTNNDDELLERGQSFIIAWLTSQLKSPSKNAPFRATLLQDGKDVKPDSLIVACQSIGLGTFRNAYEGFSADRAIKGRGK